MRIWMPILALGLVAPVLAQESTIEVQPLEPLIAPGATQNRDGGIVVRPVDPLPAPGAREEAPDRDIFGEGFNDDAFGNEQPSEDDASRSQRGENGGSRVDRPFEEEPQNDMGSLIDRFFGGAGEPEDDPFDTRGRDLPSDGLLNQRAEQGHSGWFGLENGGASGWGDNPLSEADDAPRFKSAPYTTRGLYGSNEPTPLPRVATVQTGGAEIRQLDKMTGDTRTVAIKAGQEQRIGRLRVRLEGCHAPEDGSDHGTKAFLQVWDPEHEKNVPAFSGWMFADSPALSAIDHPRYDVWVLGCTPTRAAGTVPSGNSEEG